MSNGETGCSILKESFDLLLKKRANKYNKQIESGAYACLGFRNRVCKTWDYGDETLAAVRQILLSECSGIQLLCCVVHKD